MEDYKLAYYINRDVGTLFERAEKDLDMIDKNKTSLMFPLFSYNDDVAQTEWHLISNKCTLSPPVSTQSQNSLFSSDLQTTHYLLPELKDCPYLLLLEGDVLKEDIPILEKNLRQVKGINTTQHIDIITLRSKQNLIF